MANCLTGCRRITAVLLDVTGVLYESGEGGGTVICGSIEAVARLRHAGYRLRFCSNETQISQKALVEKLQHLGFDLREEEVHCPAPVCRQYLRENQLRPYLLVHPSSLPDYQGIDTSDPNAVVLADAAQAFCYDSLNHAFRILTGKPDSKLISLGKGRYYKEGSHLTLDVGPFTKALEFATGMQAEVIGKPSAAFFMSALEQLGVSAENAMMVGDDIVGDVEGAQKCGVFGVLVRTGKYRPEDEHHLTVKPDKIVQNLSQAVELLLSSSM